MNVKGNSVKRGSRTYGNTAAIKVSRSSNLRKVSIQGLGFVSIGTVDTDTKSAKTPEISIEDIGKTSNTSSNAQKQLAEVTKMLTLSDVNLNITFGKREVDRSELVQRFTVIDRFLGNKFKANEIIVSDEQKIINEFKNLSEQERYAEFKRLKEQFYSIT